MEDFICISNNCSAGYFYKAIDKQFNNPFIWSGTTEEDLIKAIENWNDINWNNISIYKEEETNYPKINIDNTFKLRYRHYLYSEKEKTPRVSVFNDGVPNVYYCDNLKYTEEKYCNRVARMPKIKPSLIVMHWNNQWGCSDDTIHKLVKLWIHKAIKIVVFSFRRKNDLGLGQSKYLKWFDLDKDINVLEIKKNITEHAWKIKAFIEDTAEKPFYKYSLITVNFGRYDCVWEPDEVDPFCEYVYVTDDPDVKSDKFKVIVLDKFQDKSSLYKAFYVRYHIEEFVSCKLCVWIDGSIKLHKSLAPIVDKFLESGADMCCPIYYVKGSTFRFIKKWFDDYKHNAKRHISKITFFKAVQYISKNFVTNHKGHAEANFQILKLENPKVINMRKEIWKDILALGENGEPFRVDEMVLSVKLQLKYRSIKLFMVQRQLLQSSYMSWHAHNKKVRITYIPKNCIFYFYNKPQKVNTFE